MTSMAYDQIYGYFLGRISDYSIARLSQSDAYELLTEFLHKAVAKPYIRSLFESIRLDDEIQMLFFDMKVPVDEDMDTDFVCSVLSKAMVLEWLEPQVRSKINLSQYFSTGDARFFSQSQHLSELRAIYDDVTIEVRKEIRDRGYIYNSYLSED